MNQNMLYLRTVESKDIDILFEWANDRTVRENGFHIEQIPYEEHQKWFEKMLKDDNQIQYILMYGEEAVGQARLSVVGDFAEVHYSIAPEKRNMGLGKRLIQLIQIEVYSKYPDIHKIIAKVKPTNTASVRCFERNGFLETFIQYELKKDDFQLLQHQISYGEILGEVEQHKLLSPGNYCQVAI